MCRRVLSTVMVVVVIAFVCGVTDASRDLLAEVPGRTSPRATAPPLPTLTMNMFVMTCRSKFPVTVTMEYRPSVEVGMLAADLLYFISVNSIRMEERQRNVVLNLMKEHSQRWFESGDKGSGEVFFKPWADGKEPRYVGTIITYDC